MIDAAPEPLANGSWGTGVFIERHTGAEVLVKSFFAANYYATQVDALAHSANFGKRIVEGRVPGCSVP